MTSRIGRFQLDLFQCASKIENVKFREKIDVPIAIAKTMDELVAFYTKVFDILKLGEENQINDTYRSRIWLFRNARFCARIAKDFTMQTKLGKFLEKLFFMDVSNATPQKVIDLCCCFGSIEGAGSNMFWLYANRSLNYVLDNTTLNGEGPIDAS